MVYKLKVWRLPLGTPQARGKALINLLPLAEGETITAVMPMPEDEASMGSTLRVLFADRARQGPPQRARDFVNVEPERQDRHGARGRRAATG